MKKSQIQTKMDDVLDIAREFESIWYLDLENNIQLNSIRSDMKEEKIKDIWNNLKKINEVALNLALINENNTYNHIIIKISEKIFFILTEDSKILALSASGDLRSTISLLELRKLLYKLI
ncbi:MAG: hypothetical protein GF329_04010 [Candidatus Lokiarchaeota archaeon]|nr:hypothetical protein [Candidatus Lokiarchaeota archaeon]